MAGIRVRPLDQLDDAAWLRSPAVLAEPAPGGAVVYLTSFVASSRTLVQKLALLLHYQRSSLTMRGLKAPFSRVC